MGTHRSRLALIAAAAACLAVAPFAAGGASLLDRSIVIHGSAISDGNAHDHGNLPILVAGGAGGLRTGFHRRVPRETPLANLYLSVLDRLNVRVPTFGDATGRLD